MPTNDDLLVWFTQQTAIQPKAVPLRTGFGFNQAHFCKIITVGHELLWSVQTDFAELMDAQLTPPIPEPVSNNVPVSGAVASQLYVMESGRSKLKVPAPAVVTAAFTAPAVVSTYCPAFPLHIGDSTGN